MIQFNLLPDVKLNYIKTRQTKRLVTLIAIFATSVALIILINRLKVIATSSKTRLTSTKF